MIRVLVVDDNRADLELAAYLLRSCRAEVRLTAKADDVVALVHEFKPDLILLDLRLGAGSGLTVLAELAADAESQPARVAMFTASSDLDADHREATRLTEGRCVRKTGEPESFLAQVRTILAESGQQLGEAASQ